MKERQQASHLACKWSHLFHCAPMSAYKLLFRLLPSLFCFPLQDRGAGPGRRVQRGASGQSLVRGGLGEPEGKDSGPQFREVCAQGLLHEHRKGWENWLQTQQFPLWCTLCNPGYQGVDVGRAVRIDTRSISNKTV